MRPPPRTGLPGIAAPRHLQRHHSPHHADVFSHLPTLLMRALDAEPVAAVVDALVEAGWRPGQLRHRVGAAPAQGSTERDAAALLELLTTLAAQPCPDQLHAEQLRRREQERADEAVMAPPLADPVTRQRALTAMRSSVARPGPRTRRPVPEPRTRPDCSLCAGEGRFFVTREVHLCGRCVELIAAGGLGLGSQHPVQRTGS